MSQAIPNQSLFRLPSKRLLIAGCLLALLAFLIPIEHKYDKWFRFYSLTLIPEGLTVSSQYEKKIYFYLSDCIAIVLMSLGLVPLKKWFGNILWLVWICALVSIIASPFAHYPIPYFRLFQLFTPMALFSFLANVEKNYTRLILKTVVIAGIFQSLVAIAQYLYQAPLGLRFFGEVTQVSTFYIPDGSRWLFDQVNASQYVMRAAGTFPHANVFGGFMVFSILATYYLAQTRKIWLFTLPQQIAALTVSFSRSALFALSIATVIWFCFLIRSMGIKRLLPIGLALSLAFAIPSVLLFRQYMHRGGVFNYNSWVKDSDEVRKIQHGVGKQIIQDHPLWGLGFTQFSERSAPYFKEEYPGYVKITAPHNIFLFLASETGLISVGALFAFILTLFWRFFKSSITSETVLFMSLLVGFLFIGCCDFYPLLFQQGKLMFFLIAALLAANTKRSTEGIAKLALRRKFDDRKAGSVFRKLT